MDERAVDLERNLGMVGLEGQWGGAVRWGVKARPWRKGSEAPPRAYQAGEEYALPEGEERRPGRRLREGRLDRGPQPELASEGKGKGKN